MAARSRSGTWSRSLVEDLRPIAERLGCSQELLRAKRILDVGPKLPAATGTPPLPPAATCHGRRGLVLLLEMRSNAPVGLDA